MQTLSERELTARIQHREPFAAEVEDGGFAVIIKRYDPVVGTAIHDGHRLRPEVALKMALSEEERGFEEDPFTGELVESCPIVLKSLDSRYNYDLNRHPDDCIYQQAWGRQVWRQALDHAEKERLRNLHAGYFRVLGYLLGELERDWGAALIFDLHSYNHTRLGGTPPLFNLGTHYIDTKAYQRLLDYLCRELADLAIPGVDNRLAVNEVFQGRGYQAAFIREYHPASICLPLEVKKVFMDEQSLELLPAQFESLSNGLRSVFEKSARFFLHHYLRV